MDSKISNLTEATTLTNSDVLPIVNGAETKKVSIATIKSTINGVPYTGATTNVDLGEYELKAGQIELDQSPTGTAGTAITRWNDTLGITETTLKGGNVVLKNGIDSVARIVNKVTPNQTLTKANYQAVRISGATGQRLSVELARANTDNNSADTIGLVTETIATNQEGFIMTVGQLDGINTTGSLQGETWADGDVLYLSPSVAGKITNIKPTGATGHIVVIGYVEYSHINNGKIYVKIMNGWELDELHNVVITNPINEDFLQYENSTSLWKNIQITASWIRSKLGITTLSGSNTGDETSSTILSKLGYTPSRIWKSGTDGTTVANTLTITPTYSQLIPANTIISDDVLQLLFRWTSPSAKTSISNAYIYVNTVNNLTGTPIQLAIYSSGTTNRTIQLERNLSVKAGNTKIITPTSSLSTDLGLGSALTSLTIDWTVNQYIIFAIGHTVADQTSFGDFYKITKS